MNGDGNILKFFGKLLSVLGGKFDKALKTFHGLGRQVADEAVLQLGKLL